MTCKIFNDRGPGLKISLSSAISCSQSPLSKRIRDSDFSKILITYARVVLPQLARDSLADYRLSVDQNDEMLNGKPSAGTGSHTLAVQPEERLRRALPIFILIPFEEPIPGVRFTHRFGYFMI